MNLGILSKLKDRLAELDTLGSVMGLLGWDQETYMPAGGNQGRSNEMALMSRIAHEQFTAPEVGEWLEALQQPEACDQLDDTEQAMVRVAWRAYQREVRIPTSLVEALERASSAALNVWVEARQLNRFDLFEPKLLQIVTLNREKAAALDDGVHPYDALLDGYEPDMTVAQLDPLFAGLQQSLAPLVERLTHHTFPGLPPGSYSKAAQVDFSRDILIAMGFDFDRGRLDESAHPFTAGSSTGDTRLTTRVFEDNLVSCLFSALHEGGHGLYAQGHNPALFGLGLCNGASLGIHESQSRLWENLVGRSLPFWQYWYPQLQSRFHALKPVSLADFYWAINRVQPSAIRVEADEVTYNLHIVLRYQLEKDLLTGDLAVKDLPEVWNQGMIRLLGYSPKNDTEGCLQDVHWAHGTLGYFPTYTLGNLYSAMFWQQAEKSGVTQSIATGELLPLRQWLGKQIHEVGLKETPTQIVKRVTNQSLSSQPFIDYLTNKYNMFLK